MYTLAPETLLLIPCSKEKAMSGRAYVGPSFPGAIETDQGRALQERRVAVHSALYADARIDQNPACMLPAIDRYAPGNLYRVAHGAIKRAKKDGVRIVILSGGYGLLLPDEPTRLYDKKLRLQDWGERGAILKQSLSSYVMAQTSRQKLEKVVAVMSNSSPYAELVRMMEREGGWAKLGLTGQLFVPLAEGGGSGGKVPRAQGFIINALVDGRLEDGMKVENGLGFSVEPLGAK